MRGFNRARQRRAAQRIAQALPAALCVPDRPVARHADDCLELDHAFPPHAAGSGADAGGGRTEHRSRPAASGAALQSEHPAPPSCCSPYSRYYMPACASAPVLALSASALLWAATNFDPNLNFIDPVDGNHWFFNPFAWQFLFALGAGMSVVMRRNGGSLPRRPVLIWLSATMLLAGFLETFPWRDWHLPDLTPIAMDPLDKTNLSPLRLLHALAVVYLVLTWSGLSKALNWRPVTWLEACGRRFAGGVLPRHAAGCLRGAWPAHLWVHRADATGGECHRLGFDDRPRAKARAWSHPAGHPARSGRTFLN